MTTRRQIRQPKDSGQSFMNKSIRFAFFGTSHIAVFVLDALKEARLIPALIVAPRDKPKGRGLKLAPVPVAIWANNNNVPLASEWKRDEKEKWDVCIVTDYGKIIPKKLLSLPRRGFLNVHPSLLPRLRGPSPIRSAILNDEKETGVSIMLIDEEVDHGPIVAQKRAILATWPLRASELEEILMREGGKLLARILPQWVAGEIEAQEQNHDVATYSEKITKEMGLLDLKAPAYKNLLKICAYEGWPGTYAFFERPSASSGQAAKRIRVGIIDAHMSDGKLVIDTVKPEGKREMKYEEFLRSGAKPCV